MRVLLLLPHKGHQLFCQDSGGLLICAESVGVHVHGLDNEIVEGRSSLHQRAAYKSASGLIGCHGQLSGRRFCVKFAVRIDHESCKRTFQYLISGTEPCKDLVITAVHAVFSQRDCKQDLAAAETGGSVACDSFMLAAFLPEDVHVLKDFHVHAVQRVVQHLVETLTPVIPPLLRINNI